MPRVNKLTRSVIDYFLATMPEAKTELVYDTPFHLLVAVMLSAQCTDKRVNAVTSRLFARFQTAADMAAATAADIRPYIASVSYPNSKSEHLAAAARMICDEFGGEVPSDVDELQRLPGVGRKTANVVASVVYGKATMPVDTHVFRVAERLGLTRGSKSPLETERKLVAALPEEYLSIAHHWLILHGRYTCKARKPLCTECGLRQVCRYARSNAKTSNETTITTAI